MRTVLFIALLSVPLVHLAASPSSDQALIDELLRRAPGLPELSLKRAEGTGAPLSKTVRRPDGLSLSVFAADLLDTRETAVRQAFAAHADRLLLPLLLGLPPVAATSPTAPGFVEYRLYAGGVQLLLAWRSDEPFSQRSGMAPRSACEQLIRSWDAGPVPAAASPGLHRRQQWTVEREGQRFERISEWEVRSAGTGLVWQLMSDRCGAQKLTQPHTVPR